MWISLRHSCWIYLITSLCWARTHSLPLSLSPALLSSCYLSLHCRYPQLTIAYGPDGLTLAFPHRKRFLPSFISAVYFTIDTALPSVFYLFLLFLACKCETNFWR